MRVRYSLPVKGTLRIVDGPLKLHGYIFNFIANPESKYVSELVVEIVNVEQERWPTITQIEQDKDAKIPRFPFEVNPRVLRFSETEPYLLTLEGYLSYFGLDSIEFQQVKEEWISDPADVQISMQSGFSMGTTSREPVSDPVTHYDLARCIVASGKTDLETEAMAFFRMGQLFFHNRLYIDAIKYLYLFIEHLFASGKTGEKTTINEFMKSAALRNAVKTLFFESPPSYFHDLNQRSATPINTDKEFFTFMFRLRGGTQHARQSIKWHPSNQHVFQKEALCMLHLSEEIFRNIIRRKLSAVPISE